MHRRAPMLPLLLAALAPTTLGAQLPATPQNLQVLPTDIGQRELIDVMRGFADALGVRCGHCHVGQDPMLRDFDFASDEREAKLVARRMIRMVHAINTEHMATLGRPDALEVGCMTCHRGHTRPETLTQALLSAYDEGGVPSVESRYRELRERFFARAVYDFGETSLLMAAEPLGAREPAAAEAAIRMNLEHYPDSKFTHEMLGEAILSRGDTISALTHLRRALELDPADDILASRVRELGRR